MKTNKFLTALVLLAVALAFATGCKKRSPVDEEKKVAQIIKQKILGRWNLTDFIEETKKADGSVEVVDNDPKNVYFEFLTNDKGKTNAEGEEEFSYKVKADHTLDLWGYPMAITELTGNKLTFRNTATSQGITYTQTYFLSR